jgi:broad specificity phosphatase PhoE
VSRIYLVRHGQATAGWADDVDPGLDGTGRSQAAGVAGCLGALGPLPIVTSPLRRARETAAAFEARWGSDARVEPAVGEIPPPDVPLQRRTDWLRAFLAGSWSNADEGLRTWRQSVIVTVLSLPEDTVVVSHFVAINAVIGAATGDDRVLCRRLANASSTIIDTANGLGVVDLGAETEATVVRPGPAR